MLVACKILFYLQKLFRNGEKQPLSPTDISAMVVFYKSLPQGWLESFSVHVRGNASLPFTVHRKWKSKVSKVLQQCVLVYLNHISAMLFFLCCVTLSTGVGVNRNARKQWLVEGIWGRWSILVVAFHQLFKTLKSCCISVTPVKKIVSLKLAFWWERCLLAGDTAGERWLASIKKSLKCSSLDATGDKVLFSKYTYFLADLIISRPVLTPFNKTQSVCLTEILMHIKTNTHHSESVVNEHLNPVGYWVKTSFIAQARAFLWLKRCRWMNYPYVTT